MDWQLLLVAVIVMLSLVYLGRQTVRTWRGKGAGCGGCECATKSDRTKATAANTLIPVEQLKLRRR
jgi:hypothetical protein